MKLFKNPSSFLGFLALLMAVVFWQACTATYSAPEFKTMTPRSIPSSIPSGPTGDKTSMKELQQALMGKWSGILKALTPDSIGGRNIDIIIKEIDQREKKVKLVYITHTFNSPLGVMRPGEERNFEADLVIKEEPVIKWVSAGGGEFEFTLLKNGKLKGSLFGRGRQFEILMEKTE